jgi:hypothetical protein
MASEGRRWLRGSWVASAVASGLGSAEFRHGLYGLQPRAPTKRGAPTNEGHRATAELNKGSLSQNGFNIIGNCFDESQENATFPKYNLKIL